MQNGSLKTGRGVAVNGMVSTLKRQPKARQGKEAEEPKPRPKMVSGRQERGSCSSTASCPVFSGCDPDEDPPPPRCPSSLSSPSLHASSGSASSLKSLPSSSFSSSSSQRSSSEEDSWDTNSWSSGATCLLRSSIKQHSAEVFRVRAGSGGRAQGTSDSETGYQNSDSCPGSVAGAEIQDESDPSTRRDSISSTASAASTASTDLELKIEEKLKFSQFLDEVTCRVLDPKCLEAFGAPIRLNPSPWFGSGNNSTCDSRDGNASPYKWAKCMPSCKILDPSESLRRTQEGELGRSYLETDIDRVRREDEARDVEKRSVQAGGEPPRGSPSPGAPRPPYRSSSLPRPAAGTTVCDGDVRGSSSAQEQKEDLRRRLSLTTHRLQALEREFESTRIFLETQLRRAQDELDKFTERLRRIQSSYAALQRINQDMEQKIQQTTQRHEEEKRSLTREISTLNGRLMEARATIQKLRQDNDLYRKDCNLAAQLLQCGKSPYRAHKLSELPADLQERVSSHMEKQCEGRVSAPPRSYTDAVPSAVIGRVLEKPEPGSSCPVTRAPSPQAQEFLSGMEKVMRRSGFKTSDLYCSDTALYCPADERRSERWLERRQSADQGGPTRTHASDPEDDGFPFSFPPLDEPFHGFMLGSPLASCYSGKPRSPISDWHNENFDIPSYRGFSKSSSFQQVGSFPASGVPVLEDPMGGWRQMSVEDVSAVSCPFRISERRVGIAPAGIRPDAMCRSFQEGEPDFRSRSRDRSVPSMSLNALKTGRGRMLGSKDTSTCSFFKDTTEDAPERDRADHGPSASLESQNLDIRDYKKDLQSPRVRKNTTQYQKLGNAGLSRKDSLTKAQLYGTLLN